MQNIKATIIKGTGYSNDAFVAKSLSYIHSTKPYNFLIPIAVDVNIVPKVAIMNRIKAKEILEKYYDNCYFYMKQSVVSRNQEKELVLMVNNFNNINTFIGFGEYKKSHGFNGISHLYKKIIGGDNISKSMVVTEVLSNKSSYKYMAITLGVMVFVKRDYKKEGK